MGLSKKEEELIFDLAEKITGSSQAGNLRKDVLTRNVERRIHETKSVSLVRYFRLVNNDQDEYNNFVSSITIHTTSWFREAPHFAVLYQHVKKVYAKSKRAFRVWSVACSSGEEVYSTALVLAHFKMEHPDFQYEIIGSDIDSQSLKTAQDGFYEKDSLMGIPKKYHQFITIVQSQGIEKVTLNKEIKSHCHFYRNNLSENRSNFSPTEFDMILCRNVLIYFQKSDQEKIISQLLPSLGSDGLFVVGHSDSFVTNKHLVLIEGSVYKKAENLENEFLIESQKSLSLKDQKTIPRSLDSDTKKKKILVIDDSVTVRKALHFLLKEKFQLTEAESAEKADQELQHSQFDLITLDLNMPGENGMSWLRRQRQNGLKSPVIILSESSPADAIKIFGALENGAQEYFTKSRLHTEAQSLVEIVTTLCQQKKEHEMAQASGLKNLKFRAFSDKKFDPKILVIGASTGGPEALVKLLHKMPRPFPPIVIVQHISHEFAIPFGQRLAVASGLKMGEIQPNQPLQENTMYLALGDYHLQVKKVGNDLFLTNTNSVKVNGHRPSVDVLFQSVSGINVNAIGVLLTGMGQDGANGMQAMANSEQVFTMAQDAESSVVYGMPKKAMELGAVCFCGNLTQLRKQIESMTQKKANDEKTHNTRN